MGSVPHQQPAAGPLADAPYRHLAGFNGQHQVSNGQLQAPDGHLEGSNGQHQSVDGHQHLPGAGSRPVLLQTHSSDRLGVQQSHTGQGHKPGPGQGQGPGGSPAQGQPQVPRTSTPEEEGTAGGLQKEDEEKLRGISRLEEDALEAKVAAPIGQRLLLLQHMSSCVLPVAIAQPVSRSQPAGSFRCRMRCAKCVSQNAHMLSRLMTYLPMLFCCLCQAPHSFDLLAISVMSLRCHS